MCLILAAADHNPELQVVHRKVNNLFTCMCSHLCVFFILILYMKVWRTCSHILSGRIGPRMLKLQDRFPVELRRHRFILYTRRSGGTGHEGGGSDQSIGSTVSDAIVRSWLRWTATRSSALGYFSRLRLVVDNWPHILW